MNLRHALPLALACLASVPGVAAGADVPAGAVWTEATIPSTGGVQLHADILRPKQVGDARTPVILSIGPYFNHSGQTGPAGPAEDTSYDPIGPSTGPSDRFLDFINGAHLMDRGYTYVMVDLRGFGGSSGCLDWAGPGEQSDVVEAVKWAAGQKWSTGAVGMYGKSYDGVTGLIGVDHHPAGLKAVVAQEPVYDLYRYLYGDGLRRLNSVATPALYDVIAETPGPAADDPTYNLNGANTTQRPGCSALNWLDQAGNDDHYSPYYRARNLIPGAKGSDVPLFLTQGLTENNTVADGTAQYLANHTGYERAWLGPWEHVRGNETTDGTPNGRLKMGRRGWFDEIMRFYDRFLKGEGTDAGDPPIAVQTNDGTWRAEESWPPADAVDFTTELRPGTYDDDGQGSATGSSATDGVWTISPPLPYDAHLAGSGRVVVDVSSQSPNANLVVDVYDLDHNGKGPLITRQGYLVRNNGPVTMDLWSADWKLAAGHRIGVRIADANTDWWALQSPANQTVTVYGGTVALPFLAYARTRTIEGQPGVQLSSYLAKTVTVPAGTLKSSTSEDFALPPAQQAPAAAQPDAGANAPEVTAQTIEPSVLAAARSARGGARGRLTVLGPPRLRTALARGLVVRVRATPGRAVTVRALQGRRTVGSGRARAGRDGVARVRVRFTRSARAHLRTARFVRLTLVEGATRQAVVLRR